ncbi:fungal transcriptional regulatory protein [Pochonia chlamydosporia 170]|uniref:Fungal transcriptional regulatory protein n=1 Tax=Pochonia chlamydosporia 170 TaxID=1380566 RepID=A0A179F6R7_METCM|nr:fungal transcriptional regulatory protein [Pochonia chlamydosporia 170]OAQ61102.1 fungal transcriptional regulatory protein [Pochonia chlamydosporia 170]
MPSDTISETSPDSGTHKESSKDAVFVCNRSGCGRTYGKREHLQRHERSHARDFKYECPICKKRFVRRDVMTRHHALHENRPRKPRKVACVSCVSLKTRCDREQGTSCSRCRASGRECVLRSDETAQNQDSQTPNLEGHASLGSVSEASPSISLTQTVDGSVRQPPAAIPSLVDLAPITFDSLCGLAADPSESLFGWDIGDIESDNVDFLNMSPLNWFRSANDAPSNLTEPLSASDSVDLPSESRLIRDAQPPDTPWPHVYRPNEIDSQLSLPPVVQHMTTIFQDTSLECVNESTRQAMITLVNTTNNHNWPVVDVSLLPSTRTLSLCINLYFRHFHDTLPILRRSNMQIADTPPILLLAMAAIGAMYSRDKYGGLAIALNELARRVIVYTRENDQRAMFDTSFTQASLLQSMFGLFCGSRMLYQHAEISRGSLVTAARRMHLLRPSLSFAKELQRREDGVSEQELQKAQADDEERRNLGWGIYLYDMQISALLGVAPLLSVGEINVPLPVDDEERKAQRVSSDWPSAQDEPNFRTVLESLLSSGKLPQPLSSFGLSIVAHTLYRLCTDAAAFDSVLLSPRPSHDNPYRLAFPSTFKYNPQQLLDKLSASCHSLPNKPNALILSVTALSHLGHIQFTWPNFLQNIKVAAGKSGTDESKADAREWIQARIEEEPVITRSILVQAGQLSTLLSRYIFDSPAETILTFDVALTFWAITKLSSIVTESNGGGRRATITWSDSSATSDWIQQGGDVSFQALGSLSDLTSSRVLSIFIERLESMSWGIAQRFKHVLLSLQREE